VGLRCSLANTGDRLRDLAKLATGIAKGPVPAPDYEGTGRIGQHQTRLKSEQVEHLVDRYREGATTYELAKEFDCHRTTVSEVLKRAGVRLRRTGLLPDEIPEAIRLYKSGFSLVSVGERFGTTGETIAVKLRESGVLIRRPGRPCIVDGTVHNGQRKYE
jgi:hypothetical protein